jgi:DNA polymerase-3 subunit epsilon
MTTALAVTQARADAIAWARRIAADPGTVYLDTETTGLDGAAQLVDIAILDGQGAPLLNRLVRPTHPIPPDATAIHGIVDTMVADAPVWAEVYPDAMQLLAGASQVVVYNAEFDLRIINQDSCRTGLAPLPPDCRWECAMLSYAAYAGERHPRYNNWRWHRLVVAAERLDIQPTQSHRALDDARLCRAVVLAMANAG